jgi:hypothetical protein
MALAPSLMNAEAQDKGPGALLATFPGPAIVYGDGALARLEGLEGPHFLTRGS